MHSFSQSYLLIFKIFLFIFTGLSSVNSEQERANVAFLAAFCKELFEDKEEAVDENATEGGRVGNIGDKASDDEEHYEADSEETNDTAGKLCAAGDDPVSEDEGFGKDSDDRDLFDVDSDSNDDFKITMTRSRLDFLHSMMKCVANAASRDNEDDGDIINRITIHLSNRIKESASTNVADPDNLVDEERRTQTPETFGLKSIGFNPF